MPSGRMTSPVSATRKQPGNWSTPVSKGFGTAENYGVWDDYGGSKKIKYLIQVSRRVSGTGEHDGLELDQWYHVACTHNGSMVQILPLAGGRSGDGLCGIETRRIYAIRRKLGHHQSAIGSGIWAADAEGLRFV